MLFSKKLANTVTDIRRDIHGRWLICKLMLNNYTYCVVNIYAPNEGICVEY